MKKIVSIEGMMCQKCVAHAKKALEDLNLEAEVSLEEKKAYIKDCAVSDADIIKAIQEAGYDVIKIENE